MDTANLLITGNNDWIIWLVFGVSLVCLLGSLIALGIVRHTAGDERYPMFYLFMSMGMVLSSGLIGLLNLQDDGHRIDAEAVTAALHDDYGVEHIKTGTPEAGGHIDMDDPSKNTYDAAEMTVGDATYKDCQATFGPASKHDHKTYRSMQVTCQSADEQHQSVTLKPTTK